MQRKKCLLFPWIDSPISLDYARGQLVFPWNRLISSRPAPAHCGDLSRLLEKSKASRRHDPHGPSAYSIESVAWHHMVYFTTVFDK